MKFNDSLCESLQVKDLNKKECNRNFSTGHIHLLKSWPVSKGRIRSWMKVIFEHGAHDAVKGAGEQVNEAGVHVVDVSDRPPSCSLVAVYGNGQFLIR